MAYYGSGRNPAYGPDCGPPPPTNQGPYGAARGFGYPYPQQLMAGYPAMYQQQQDYWQAYRRPFVMPGQAVPNQGGYFSNTANPTQYAATGQVPSGDPVIQGNIPAVNMTNSTGGVGCEPGYNYFFAPAHTKIHVLLTGEDAPWNLEPNWAIDFYAVHVPTNTTIGELLKGFGATNPEPEMNKVFEVHQGGNGRWYKGMSFRGDDKDAMAKTIKDVGWDSSRNGQPGGKPVVWLYVVKG